jgi:hypothetical protein
VFDYTAVVSVVRIFPQLAGSSVVLRRRDLYARIRALGMVPMGVMGGIISGYNYGQIGLGQNNRTGPVLAPAVMTRFGRFGVNFILIPPIHEDNLPFTVGFQAKYRFH